MTNLANDESQSDCAADVKRLARAFESLALAYQDHTGIAFSRVISHHGISVLELRAWLSGQAR